MGTGSDDGRACAMVPLGVIGCNDIGEPMLERN